MNLCSLTKSVLIYLLLCYGKKFANSNRPGSQNRISSQRSKEVGDIGDTGSLSGRIGRRSGPSVMRVPSRPTRRRRGVHSAVESRPSCLDIDPGVARRHGSAETDLGHSENVESHHRQRYRIAKSQTKRKPAVLDRGFESEVSNVAAGPRRGDRPVGRRRLEPPDSGLPSRTLIEIDITHKESTDEVKYKWDPKDEIHVYTARDPYLISKVFKRDKVIWKAQNDRYAQTVTVGVNERGKPKLTVLYPEDLDHERDRPDGQRPPSHPDLIEVDIKNKRSTQYVEYYRDDNNDRDLFVAYEPYLISAVYKGDRLAWKAHDGYYPHTVVVRINERGKQAISFEYRRELARGRRVRTRAPPVPLEPKARVINLDVNSRMSSRKYRYEWDERDRRDVYTARKPFLFTTVQRGAKVVWRSKGSRYASKITLGVNRRGKPVLGVFYPDEAPPAPAVPEPVPERVERPKPVEPVEVPEGYVTVDVTLKSSTRTVKYLRDEEKELDVYIPKGKYVLKAARKGDKIVWEALDSRYPDSIIVGVNKQGKLLVRVVYPEGMKPLVERIPKVVRHVPREEVPKPEVAPAEKPEVEKEKPKPPERKPEKEPEPSEKEKPKPVEKEEEKKPEEVKRKESVASDEGGQVEAEEPVEEEKEPISIDVSVKDGGDHYGYAEKDDLATFNPKGKYIFSKVLHKGVTVWSSTDPDAYANKITADGIGRFKSLKNLTVYVTTGELKHFNKSDGAWSEFDPEIVLDLKSSQGTYQYEYARPDDLSIFTTRSNFIFKGIKARRSCACLYSCCCPAEDIIWIADKRANYSKKITVDGLNASVYMENGDIKHFYSRGRFSPWEERSNQFELDIDSKQTTYRYNYKISGLGTYTPRHDFLYKVVKQTKCALNCFGSDQIIWSASNEGECANRVVIDGTDANASPHNVTLFLVNGDIKHFTKKSYFADWEELSTNVELDIKDQESSISIDYTLRDTYRTYVPNFNFVITKIKERDTVIWEADQNRFTKNVIVKGVGVPEKEMIIQLPTGERRYRKSGKNQPWQKVDMAQVLEEETLCDGAGAEDKVARMKAQQELAKTFLHEKLQIYTQGSTTVNDTGAYVVNKESDRVEYVFNDGVKCEEIKYGDIPCWKFEADHGNLYPRKVIFSQEKLLIAVDMQRISTLYRYTGSDLKVVYIRRPVPVDLNLEEIKSTLEYDYFTGPEAAYFRPVQNFAFNPLKVGNTLLYRADNAFSYVDRIELRPIDSPKKVIIRLLNGAIKQFERVDKEKTWAEATPEQTDFGVEYEPKVKKRGGLIGVDGKDAGQEEQVTPVDLDLTLKEEGDGYEFTCGDKFRVYKAEDGYKFQGVQGRNWYCFGKEYIWYTEDDDEYADQVEVRMNSIGFLNEVNVFQKDGEVRKFKKKLLLCWMEQ